MTNILAMDTSGPSLSVALMQGERLTYECMLQNGMTHSQSLMPLVDAALEAGKLSPIDLDCIAVVTGPGSFTGVRIGVTTAKALAHAANKPVLGINALEAIAAGVPLFDGLVCALQDARAGQVYAAGYQGGVCVIPDAALKLEDFLALTRPYARCCFVGDGAVAHKAVIKTTMGERAVFAPPEAMALSAGCVAALAKSHPERAIDAKALTPYYLRAPQAERERLAREASHA